MSRQARPRAPHAHRVDRYLLFYKVDDAAYRVITHSFFHQRQEYEGLL